jgi:hypothetical protein
MSADARLFLMIGFIATIIGAIAGGAIYRGHVYDQAMIERGYIYKEIPRIQGFTGWVKAGEEIDE